MSASPPPNPVWEALTRALAERGRAITTDGALCRSVLNDLLGRDAREHRYEVTMLVGAVESGAAGEIADATSVAAVNLDNLASGLELRGLPKANAMWALQMWMGALGVPVGQPRETLPRTVAPSPPPTPRRQPWYRRQPLLSGLGGALVVIFGIVVLAAIDNGKGPSTTTTASTTTSTTTTTTVGLTPEQRQVLTHVRNASSWTCGGGDRTAYDRWGPVAAVSCAATDAAGTTVFYVQLGSRSGFDQYRDDATQRLAQGSCDAPPAGTVAGRYKGGDGADAGWMRCGTDASGPYIEWGHDKSLIVSFARNRDGDYPALFDFWKIAGPDS